MPQTIVFGTTKAVGLLAIDGPASRFCCFGDLSRLDEFFRSLLMPASGRAASFSLVCLAAVPRCGYFCSGQPTRTRHAESLAHAGH
jgi:hypothetical protein